MFYKLTNKWEVLMCNKHVITMTIYLPIDLLVVFEAVLSLQSILDSNLPITSAK